jgi:regulator of RNase E activity RraA
MTKHLNAEQIEALRKIDTPTICNLLEMVAPERRGVGFTTKYLHCCFPNLPPMVGYAKTATIRAKEPGSLGGDDYMQVRFKYFDYVAAGPTPRVSVIQDLDDGQPGYGSFWGEVNSNVHKALGCEGVVTNGSVRDLDMIAPGFQFLAGVIAPSHAFVHLVHFDCEVNVHGMVVRSGDLIHADKHGAVVIPHGVADKVAGAFDLMSRREAVVIEAARSPDFTVEKLKAAFRTSAAIKA